MKLVNFRFETDTDGIALATWDMPGRSMNVITTEVGQELSAIIDEVAGNAAIKGCVIASGKDGFSGGADLTMLEAFGKEYAALRKSKGEEEAVAALSQARNLRQALRRGDPRRVPGRCLRARSFLPFPGRCR
jgi:3-hydroxyacyl-CoA dehydrogenase / enoyl-CoA hydratase / 3-hydroxybutyryl-CoA epimerase